MKRENRLRRLKALGQSIWIDDIRRRWLKDGTLARLIVEDGVSGVTSNPAIFHKAISESNDYDAAIVDMGRRGIEAAAIIEKLMIDDIREAADQLRGVYDATGGRDGYVSLEVSPHLAHDTVATMAEALRLWKEVERPNLMVKVPGTPAGLPAIRTLTASGVNVNITLLFSVERYREVAEAYIAGLEERQASGNPLGSIASVASFFVSRIDVLVDKRLDEIGTPQARKLRGEAAIACARLAYQAYEEIIAAPRWQVLSQHGAKPQRLLWGSTGTKDPTYSNVKYVEELIGPDTINTVPIQTLEAFRDHGTPAVRIAEDLQKAEQIVAQLSELGISLESASLELEDEGVRKFIEPHDALLSSVEQKIRI